MERAKTARSMGPEVEKTHSGAEGKGVRPSLPSLCSPTPSPLTSHPHLLLPGIFPSPSSLPCPSPTLLGLFSHLCGGGGRGGGSQEQVSSLQHNLGPFPFRYRQLCLSSRGGGDSGPAFEGGTVRGSGHVGAAGALASHLGCAAAELASRVASRYVAPRDVGSGLVAGAGLDETGTLSPCHWRRGTPVSPGYPDWLLFRPRWVSQVEGLPGLSICLPLSSRQTEHLSISADPLCPCLWSNGGSGQSSALGHYGPASGFCQALVSVALPCVF